LSAAHWALDVAAAAAGIAAAYAALHETRRSLASGHLCAEAKETS